MSLRLLIAEDSETNRLVLSMTLARLGYAADIAANGAEALALFKQNSYDLVFLDLNMPILDGIKAAAEIRKINKKDTPVYAISGFAAPQMEAFFESSGIRRCLLKPLDREKMAEVMAECGLQKDGPRRLAVSDASVPQKLIKTYVHEIGSRQKAARRFFEEGNRPGLYRECHTIRNLAQMMNMQVLEKVAAGLEDICMRETRETLAPQVEALAACCEEAIVELLDEFTRSASSGSASGGLSRG